MAQSAPRHYNKLTEKVIEYVVAATACMMMAGMEASKNMTVELEPQNRPIAFIHKDFITDSAAKIVS